ncbi:hypothetical protein Tco_0352831 [Tanacetum coccineum]
MRTRSQSRNSNRQQQQVPPTFVEPFNLVEPIENQALPVVTMDDTRIMAKLLEAPTVGSHAAICYFNKMTSTMKFPNVPNSLNSIAGGNFLDKMTRDCLRIIESKSKVRNSRNKPVVAKVSLSSSNPGISPDVAELKDMVKALLLDKKNQTQAPAPVKAAEKSCVTCGGAHSYRNFPSTDGNIYRDNIQEFVSQAAAANFNQGNTGYRAPIANQIRPLGFPPVQNQGNNQNCYNQNRGNNYNQSQIYRPSINQHPVHQAQPYQAPAPQTQGVTKNDFESYVKANDAFVNSNTASTSSSGTLPSNTITNPKVDLKGITTRSGVAYQGPTIPTTTSSLPKVVERETEETKDTPVVTPISATMPNLKPSIPNPSRRNDEKHREKANDQIKKFYKIFQDMSFEISLADALILMPKFARLKALIGKKKIKSSFSDVIASGNPTPYYDPIVSTSSPTLTPFGDSDFLLEEVDAFLALEDDPTSLEVDDSYYDPEGDILLLESFLNDDPSLPPPTQGNYFPKIRKELKVCEAKTDKSSIDEPPEVELKDLPPHLEYAFLEGDNKLPVIIAKDLSVEEKAVLIKVLKSHKRAIAWKLSDIKGINPEFCTHKILTKEDYKPVA